MLKADCNPTQIIPVLFSANPNRKFLYPNRILFVLTLLYLGNISTSSELESPDVLLHSFSMLPTASLLFVCDLVNDLGSSAGSSILQNTCPCFFTDQH